MEHIAQSITSRRSVRTFDGRDISPADMEKLKAFMGKVENPYGIPVDFKLISAKEKGLTCPVVSGTDLYVGGKIKQGPNANEAFGYTFEMMVLYAQSLGIGTVWLGGTMNRSAFEAAMDLHAEEIMPCASPLGYPARKMSIKENVMRKAIKADERLAFEELFFDGTFEMPLTREKAGQFARVLDMVRLAPSAVNKQPWRVVMADRAAHFYLKRSKGFSASILDMQKIDMGIALCHFELAAKEVGLSAVFSINDPQMTADPGLEYIASYRIEQ